MDKLQWFKFAPSDWSMGKIRRCPEITQARFIMLCCLYWNKECELSIEDAEIEVDEEHYKILVKKKVIKEQDGFIKIAFLDEQMVEITDISKSKSKAAKARWDKYNSKKVDITSNADAMHVHKDVMQNDAEKSKRREEEIREEEGKKKKKFNFRLSLIELGVDKQVAEDWMKVRAKKKATNTETAFKQLKTQLGKTTKTANECITLAVEKSWIGFRSEWIDKDDPKKYDPYKNIAF